jgi:hypothetical protein
MFTNMTYYIEAIGQMRPMLLYIFIHGGVVIETVDVR